MNPWMAFDEIEEEVYVFIWKLKSEVSELKCPDMH